MPSSKYYESDSKDPYPEIRGVFGPQYRNLPPEDIEAILENANIDPEYMENFLSTLGNIGRSVVSALPSILPVAGTVLGTAVGGPVGGAIGGSLGTAAGGALSGGRLTGQPPRAPQVTPPGSQPLQMPPQPVTLQTPGTSPAAANSCR